MAVVITRDPGDTDTAPSGLARVQMSCCGAYVLTSWEIAPSLAELLDSAHECVPVLLCDGA